MSRGSRGLGRRTVAAEGRSPQTPEGDSFTGGWRKADSEDTWGHVLVHGRGTVGETALHLLFLINSPQHRRLTKLLVPLLSTQVLTIWLYSLWPLAVHTIWLSYYRLTYFACAAPLDAQRTPDVDGTDVNVLDASYIGQPYHGEVSSEW